MARHRYLIALGSNRRHSRLGGPRGVIEAALVALAAQGIDVLRKAPILLTPPLGPSLRVYANSAAIVETADPPEELLALLKQIEAEFGRRARGQRWSARVLDLDIILWDGGAFTSPDLVIPHSQFRKRDFVLHPAAAIAPDWRDPLTGLTLHQLTARLTAPRPLSRWAPRRYIAGHTKS